MAYYLLKDVEWCYVEHAPEVNSAANSPEQLALLNEEYQLLCMRTKNLNTQKPSFCVNSRLPILSLISVQRTNPEMVESYRQALYSVYWREGLDISDPSVLKDIQHRLNMDYVEILEDADHIQASYQKQWEYGGLDGRIPAMKDGQGRILLGLQHVGNIRAFMHGLENLDLSTLVCSVHEKPVIGFYNVSEVKSFFEKEALRYRFIDYDRNISSPSHGPDIILAKADESNLIETLNILR